MKIVFFGTPDFAAVVLERVIAEGYEVATVVTQPDKPKGRSGGLAMPPVKEAALQHAIPVLQPVKIKGNDEFYEEMKVIAPDIAVVVAFGQILPQSLLVLPQYGCINVHASLLPAYRGAAPIQWAVIDGLATTGVTTMQMDTGVDTGDILMQAELSLAPKETGGSLFEKLSMLGADLLIQTLQALTAGNLQRTPQDDSRSSYAKMLDKRSGELDFSKSAVVLERLIRGLNPWPSAYTTLNGKMLKIWDADVVSSELIRHDIQPECEIGEISLVAKDAFYVKCGEDYLKVNEVQLEGKKRMSADAFLRGFPVRAGQMLAKHATDGQR